MQCCKCWSKLFSVNDSTELLTKGIFQTHIHCLFKKVTTIIFLLNVIYFALKSKPCSISLSVFADLLRIPEQDQIVSLLILGPLFIFSLYSLFTRRFDLKCQTFCWWCFDFLDGSWFYFTTISGWILIWDIARDMQMANVIQSWCFKTGSWDCFLT